MLVGIAQTLITEYAISDVLFAFCDDIVSLLPVSGAGVMLVGSDHVLRFAAASDEAVAVIGALEEELGEGPCAEAFTSGSPVLVNDLAGDEVHPVFAGRALAEGLRSVQAFPMRVHQRLIGALSLYGVESVSLDGLQQEAATTLAACAAAYVLNARALDEAVLLSDQLQRALDGRVVIEQAKVKLAEQLGKDPEEAFVVMRRHARNNGQRLADVAAGVVDGTLLLNYGPHSAEPQEPI